MLNFSAPIGSVSFGYVATNILFELFSRGINLNFFPIGGQVDLSSYPAAKQIPGFEDWLRKSIFYSLENFNRNNPSLSLWHILDSEKSIGANRNLLTFHELDSLTKTEANILANCDNVFVTSKYSQEVFKQSGVNSFYCPLGFDARHFRPTNRKYFQDNRIVISVFGKLEPSRKRHIKVIPALVKKFGNDRRFNIHLSVYNQFLSPEQNNGLVLQLLGGSKPFNFNILPYTTTLTEFNENLNVTNIVVDAGNESWSIPSFSCVALGKYGVLANYGAIKDWSVGTNSEMINSIGKIPVYDGMFFREGDNKNQGNIHDFDENEMIVGVERAIEKYRINPVNTSGLLLQEEYTWERTVDTILNNIGIY